MTSATSWEFWPSWLFYAPVGVFVAALAARYGLRAVPAANPGLEDGGLVGESKAGILKQLPARWTIPFLLAPEGTSSIEIAGRASARGWPYPLVVKPDVGQRGAGVTRVHDVAGLEAYRRAYTGPVLVQPWHPGPFEAGIFYVRRPHESRGRIFSITDKQFPSIVGDGHATIEQLIPQHPRFRRQAALFLARHAAARRRVLAAGERFVLGAIGNHAQGALFADGGHLITPALEERIDEIARAVPGFFIGRFDVRYRDVDRFTAGLDLAIVELNGVTAESTNIYDPSRSLMAAYRTLFEQWHMIFDIGAANLARGEGAVSLRRIASLIWRHLTDRRSFPVAG
jgi:hypothetical protein